MLAGISVDYYLRLEQGRGGQPSEQVLRSLARVLQLDEAATDYLLDLIAPQPAAPAPEPGGEQVPSSVLNLLDVIGLPAFVTGQKFDVLAAVEQRNTPKRGQRAQLGLTPTGTALLNLGTATIDRVAQQLAATLPEHQEELLGGALLTLLSAMIRQDSTAAQQG